MRRIIILIFVVVTLACKKEALPTYAEMAIHTPGPQEFGVATAKLNGQDWEASVYPNLDLLADGYVRLSFYTETEQGYLRDAVRTAMYDTTNQTLTTVEVIDSL